MSDYLVIRHRPDGRDLDRRIDALQLSGGTIHSIDDFIAWIESGLHRFFVSVRGRQVKIVVRQHGLMGRKYLTTDADNFPPNNLLSLPVC